MIDLPPVTFATRVRINSPGAWCHGHTGRVTECDTHGASVLLVKTSEQHASELERAVVLPVWAVDANFYDGRTVVAPWVWLEVVS